MSCGSVIKPSAKDASRATLGLLAAIVVVHRTGDVWRTIFYGEGGFVALFAIGRSSKMHSLLNFEVLQESQIFDFLSNFE